MHGCSYSSGRNAARRRRQGAAQWFQTQKPAKTNFLKSDFTSFSFKLMLSHTTSVCSCSKLLIFKIRQTVTSQFYKFYQSQFWLVFVIWPKCAAASRRRVRCSSLLGTTKNATKSLSLGQCPPLTTTTQLRLLFG